MFVRTLAQRTRPVPAARAAAALGAVVAASSAGAWVVTQSRPAWAQDEFGGMYPEDMELEGGGAPQAVSKPSRDGPVVGRPEDWRKIADDIFNDQNLVKGVEFGTHAQLLPPPKNTSLAIGVAFATDQFPEQHGVHMQLSTSVKGNQLVGTANPTMGEYRAIWNRELLPGLRSNAMCAVTNDGQHDTANWTLHYVPLRDFSLMAKLKMSAAQPTSAELHYLQAINNKLVLGAMLSHSLKQETKHSVFGRYLTRSTESMEPAGGQQRSLLLEESFYAALPWPVLELHYVRRYRSPSPMQFPGTDFSFGSELRMHIQNRDAVAKFGLMTNMQTFKFQAAVDSQKRLTAQLSTVISEQLQMKFAAELNHAENTSQFGISFDFPLL